MKRTIAIAVIALIALWGQTAAIGEGPAPLPEALQPVTQQLSPIANPAAAMANWRASQSGVNAATVFPPDDRTEVADTTAVGWRTITQVVSFDAAANPLGECSGTMIGDDVVLTAAHCVFNGGQYVDSIVVSPGSTITTNPFGLAAATRFAVPKGWADTVGNDAPGSKVPLSPYDWALVFLDNNPFHGQIGPYLTVADATDSYFQKPGLEIATAGFPGDKAFGSMWTANTTDFFVDSDYLATTLDIFPGQSGSPIYTLDPDTGDGFIFSVVSVGNDLANFSVRFTPTVIDALHTYCANNGCSFASETVQDDYAFNGTALCRNDPKCTAGDEPLLVGQPVHTVFEVSPNPTAPIYADVYLNGTKISSWSWAAPTAPGPAHFYISDATGVGIPTSPGTIAVRIWVGPVYVGSFSAQVLTALPVAPTPTPSASPSPTTTASPTPSPSPSPSPSPTATPAPTVRPKLFHVVLPGLALQ